MRTTVEAVTQMIWYKLCGNAEELFLRKGTNP